MSRPMALGLVLLVLILTSQSDWKQDTRTELEDSASSATKPEDAFTNHNTVKQEIILMQEKEIHELKLQVRSLEEKLRVCQCENSTAVEQTSAQLNRRVAVEPVAVEPVAARLRGNVWPSRDLERPGEFPVLDEALIFADDDVEKIGDR